MPRLIAMVVLLFWPLAAGLAAAAEPPDVETIVRGLEARYATGGLTADFDQTSTLKAMDITDTAQGRLWIRRPGQMRWEYTAPERQVIISDGVQLWVYRPDDRQVMIGRAPSFFGDGKGASFLSDIRQLRRQFDIALTAGQTGSRYGLTLTPHDPQPDLMRIELEIDPKNFTIRTVTTFNAYGDQTRITLRDVVFLESLDDALFRFEIPEGVEIMQMEQ